MRARLEQRNAIIVMTALALSAALAGCATGTRGGGDAVYRESASDVASRAPRSMSPPDQDAQPLDERSMREQADFHFALAEAYALDGNVASAVDEYKLALVYDQKSPAIRMRLAAAYVKRGLVSEAMEQAKIAIEIDPKSEDARLLLGGLQSALRMYDEALATYRKVEEINPKNTEAPLFVGALLAEQKKFTEAIAVFEELAKRPKNASLHLARYYLGRVRLEQDANKNRKAAEADLKGAIAAKPSFVDAVAALGALYEASDRKKEAIALYRSFQAKQGPDSGVAENLARLYLEAQEYALALEQLEVVEAADPENLGARMKIAFVLIEQKRFREAIVKLEDLLGKAPDSDKVRFYLGAVYEEIKDYKGAVGAFGKVPPGSAYYAEAVVHSAYLHKLEGEMPKAIETVEAGIRNKSDYPQFYSLYASFLDDGKEYAKAAQVLEKAVKRFPDHAQLRFFLGSMQDRVGDFEGMVASMRRVLEIDGNHVQALNYLAYTFAERNQKLDEAESLVRKAMSLQPRDGYIMDTLGWVLFKRGQFGDAVRVLESAVKLAPNEAVIAEHLGDAYYKFQLPEKAKKMYMKATEYDANPDNVRKIRSKMATLDRQVPPTSSSSAPERAPASRSAH